MGDKKQIIYVNDGERPGPSRRAVGPPRTEGRTGQDERNPSSGRTPGCSSAGKTGQERWDMIVAALAERQARELAGSLQLNPQEEPVLVEPTPTDPAGPVTPTRRVSNIVVSSDGELIGFSLDSTQVGANPPRNQSAAEDEILVLAEMEHDDSQVPERPETFETRTVDHGSLIRRILDCFAVLKFCRGDEDDTETRAEYVGMNKVVSLLIGLEDCKKVDSCRTLQLTYAGRRNPTKPRGVSRDLHNAALLLNQLAQNLQESAINKAKNLISSNDVEVQAHIESSCHSDSEGSERSLNENVGPYNNDGHPENVAGHVIIVVRPESHPENLERVVVQAPNSVISGGSAEVPEPCLKVNVLEEGKWKREEKKLSDVKEFTVHLRAGQRMKKLASLMLRRVLNELRYLINKMDVVLDRGLNYIIKNRRVFIRQLNEGYIEIGGMRFEVSNSTASVIVVILLLSKFITGTDDDINNN